MRLYDIVFWFISFFLFGVLLASFGLKMAIVILIALLLSALFLFWKYTQADNQFLSKKLLWFSVLTIAIILGAFYFNLRDKIQKENINIVFNKKTNFSAVVSGYPKRGNTQELIVSLKSPYSGKILLKLSRYPGFDYGDLLNLEGIIKHPDPPEYASYLAKNGVYGIADFPKAQLTLKNQASSVKAALFSLKESVISNLDKVLPPEKAALLSGITLGERAEFSKNLKEAMSNSGTTHIVALSGYNISIVASAAFGVFSYFFTRQISFALSLFTILGFVVMAGSEASVVRAAIMGSILLLANQLGRTYSFRNAISIAAFIMILVNPKILRFDIGFQLSFLALLGIVYLKPAIQKFFHFKAEPGFLFWRENLLTTLSAQLLVLPILVISFGNFSFLSLLSNILVLTFIPLTMTLGFILGALGFISYYISLVFAWLVSLLLSYEIFIIKLFGSLKFLQIKSLSIPLAAVYYLAIIAFMAFSRRRKA